MMPGPGMKPGTIVVRGERLRCATHASLETCSFMVKNGLKT